MNDAVESYWKTYDERFPTRADYKKAYEGDWGKFYEEQEAEMSIIKDHAGIILSDKERKKRREALEAKVRTTYENARQVRLLLREHGLDDYFEPSVPSNKTCREEALYNKLGEYEGKLMHIRTEFNQFRKMVKPIIQSLNATDPCPFCHFPGKGVHKLSCIIVPVIEYYTT